MKTSTWTESELQSQFSQCATLQDVIASIETDFSTRGEVICEIRVNGMILQSEDEAKYAANPVAGIRDLAVRSNRPGDLVREALVSAAEFLPHVEESVLTTAELLRGTNLNQSKQALSQTLSSCEELVDTLIHIRQGAVSIGQPLKETEEWSKAEAMTNEVILNLAKAHEKSDFVLIADILEYEMTTALQLWGLAIAAI